MPIFTVILQEETLLLHERAGLLVLNKGFKRIKSIKSLARRI